MNIARMEAAHVVDVAVIERECFSEPWSEHALELLLTPDAIGVVCVCDGAVAAYGGMLWAPYEGQITNIAVREAYRKRGYGAALLEALIAAARERDCEQISLEVRESNAAAIALYEKYGFSIAGRRKRFYKAPTEDGLVMILTLINEKG